MGSILDIPDFREKAATMPVAQYHRLIELGEMDKNVELISGYLIEKMSKSPLHTFVVKELLEILIAAIDQSHFLIRKEEPLTFRDSEPEPDLAIVEGTNNDFRDCHPSTAKLIIEVAVSSIKIDQTKATIYAEASVDEYWIVRPEGSTIEVFREPQIGGYKKHEIIQAIDKLTSSQFDSIQITLAEIMS